MRRFLFLLALGSIFPFMQSCNTLLNSQTIKLEIIVPAKVILPKNYGKVALRYNNCNVSENMLFADYYEEKVNITDTSNLDSIASEVYFSVFAELLKEQQFFDSIVILEPGTYSGIIVIDSTTKDRNHLNFSLYGNDITLRKADEFNHFLREFPVKKEGIADVKYSDPDYALYSQEETQQIKDSTGAGLLLSFDYFAAVDAISLVEINNFGFETGIFTGVQSVFILAFWNIYDLQTNEILFTYNKLDTISWTANNIENLQIAKKLLPNRKEAVLNAADIAGTKFTGFLIPTWIEVERMYYRSEHVELKQTERLIYEDRWLEAANIWKKNTENPNKSIAAKSMYNMALACEMEGKIDAAIDWAVRSFHVFGQKNEVHYLNCIDYIQILAQRKLDIKNIEKQMKLTEPKNE